jgi:hypothetical protein
VIRARSRAPLTRVAAIIGIAGAALGIVAGLIELTAGPSIRSWVGNKQDTTGLGLATIALSGIALAAALALRRWPRPPVPWRVVIVTGLLWPGVLCFTTVGRLWYLPGALLVASGLVAAAAFVRR